MKNEYKINGDETVIMLYGKKRSEVETVIDTADLPLVDKYPIRWAALWGPALNGYYCYGTFKNKFIVLHRIITNAPSDKMVDHINHNTLDNRKSNLRICTNSENQMNQKPQQGRSSKYKGVYWNNRDKRFIARIKKDKKLICLGSFKNELEAAKAYNNAALKLHGEFAFINEIQG